MDEKQWQYFLETHSNMPRQGPGSVQSTTKAWQSVNIDNAKILDIGCGPGQQTITLASLCNGHITALDFHQPFLDQLQTAVMEKGLEKRIVIQKGDMCKLEYPDESFDVLWVEGAIFIIGFEKGLQEWKRLLKPGGFMAVSELSWIRQDIPDELQEYFQEIYPPMTSIENNLETFKSLGYDPISYHIEPPSDWWDGYYNPLKERIQYMYKKYQNNNDVLQVLKMEEREIEIYKKYSKYYSNVFYVVKKL